MPRNRWIVLVLLSALPFGCARAATMPPRAAGSLATSKVLSELIKVADPDAVVESGSSGGGGGGGMSSITGGTTVHASYEYTYTAQVRSKVPLGRLLKVLREELQSELKKAGATITGKDGGPTTGQTSPGAKVRTLRTQESLRFQKGGYRGDLFLVAWESKEERTDYSIVIRITEFFAG